MPKLHNCLKSNRFPGAGDDCVSLLSQVLESVKHNSVVKQLETVHLKILIITFWRKMKEAETVLIRVTKHNNTEELERKDFLFFCFIFSLKELDAFQKASEEKSHDHSILPYPL